MEHIKKERTWQTQRNLETRKKKNKKERKRLKDLSFEERNPSS